MKSHTQHSQLSIRTIQIRTKRSTYHAFTPWHDISYFVLIAIALTTQTIVGPVFISAFSTLPSLSRPNALPLKFLEIPQRQRLSNRHKYQSERTFHDRRRHLFPTTEVSLLAPRQSSLPTSSPLILYSFFQNNNDPDSDTDSNDIDDSSMENNPRDQWFVSSMTTTMVCTQAAFIPIGVVLATMVGIDLNFLQLRSGTDDSMLWLFGVLSTVPLVIFAVVLDIIEDRVPALQEVSDATLRSVYNLLGGSYKPLLALVTAVVLGTVAGVGEEILFRGILQETMYQQHWTENYDTVISIVLSSIIFGLFHAVTPMYAALATIASMYFGTLYTLCDGDLTIPILCHSIYDIGALLYAHYTISQLSFPKLQQLIVGSDSETSSTSSANVE